MMISAVENARSTNCEDIDLRSAFRRIRGDEFRNSIDRIRNSDKASADTYKKTLPGFLFSGRFSRRNASALAEHSGLVCADFDQLEDPEGWREAFASDRHVVGAFVSPSGKGLKTLFKVDKARPHEESWLSMAEYVAGCYGLSPDPACKDVSRICFASHDPDAFFREPDEAQILPLSKQSSRDKRDQPRESPSLEEIESALSAIPPRPDYDTWLRIASAVWNEVGEVQGNGILERWSPEYSEGEYEIKFPHRLGRISVRTLFYIAIQHGWRPSRSSGCNAKELSEAREVVQCRIDPKESQTEEHGEAVYPMDSILDRWMRFGRRQSESEDSFILGSILPVCSAALARNVYFDFGTRKYPNIYAILAAKAGFRKSTCIGLSEQIARRFLPKETFTSSIASEEALFSEYNPEDGGSKDKFLIVDEGNTIFSNWSDTSYGRIVAKRYLTLYDCKGWRQSFQKNKKTGSGVREIDSTSTSILIGATLNVARFQGLESKDGMRRRFLTYLSERFARRIYIPESVDSEEFDRLCMDFSMLRRFAGKIQFGPDARETWVSIQDNNRDKLEALPSDGNERSEALGSLLAEEPSHTLKVAMIFECCRSIYANSTISPNSPPPNITANTLRLAYKHVENCVDATLKLERQAEKASITQECDRVYDIVLAENNTFDVREETGNLINVVVRKSDLTKRFCNNATTRVGSMSTDYLYNKLLPELIRQGKCVEIPTKGKLRRFCFIYQNG